MKREQSSVWTKEAAYKSAGIIPNDAIVIANSI